MSRVADRRRAGNHWAWSGPLLDVNMGMADRLIMRDVVACPARALSVSYTDGALARLMDDLDKLSSAVVERIQPTESASGSYSDEAVLTDAPSDFSYRSAYTWQKIRVNLTEETDRKFYFDDDEHENVWM